MEEKPMRTSLRMRTEYKSGKRWQGIIEYPIPNPDYVPAPEAGKDTRTRKQRRRTIDKRVTKLFPAHVKTEAQARRALAEWEKEYTTEAKAQELPSAHSTVGDYVSSFIDDLEASGNVERTTISDYRTTAKRIGEAFPGVALADLSRVMVQKWENRLSAQRIAPRTIIKYHRLLSQVCKTAVNNDELPKNPCDGVKLPKRIAPRPNALDENGYKRLAAALELIEPTPLATAATIALYTGMRQGEICGLRWRCVDLKNRRVYVEESIGHATGGSYSKAPKTKKSRREIPITDKLAQALERRRAQMVREFEQAGIPLTSVSFADLYVIGWIDGRFYSPVSLSKQWAGMSQALGLVGTQGRAVTFHDLRHTLATQLIAQGADVSAVSALLGHSSTSLTLDVYADANPQNKRRAIGYLDNLTSDTGAEPYTLVVDVTSEPEE